MEENLIQINAGVTVNVDASVKKVMYVKKDYIWNPSTCSCKNGKYLASIKYDSAVMCNEVIESWNEEAKTVSTNFYEKMQPVKSIIASC